MYGLTDPIIGRCYASLAPAFAAREEALRLQTPQTALARAESVKKFFKKNIKKIINSFSSILLKLLIFYTYLIIILDNNFLYKYYTYMYVNVV